MEANAHKRVRCSSCQLDTLFDENRLVFLGCSQDSKVGKTSGDFKRVITKFEWLRILPHIHRCLGVVDKHCALAGMDDISMVSSIFCHNSEHELQVCHGISNKEDVISAGWGSSISPILAPTPESSSCFRSLLMKAL